MPLNKYDQYTISADKHKRLWENAIFVFDTSSLLEFYFYSESTKEKIFDQIFEKLKGRLWLPSHVSYEFQKNRQKVMSKPIGFYQNLDSEATEILKLQTKIETCIFELKSKTKKDDKHPFIDQSLFSEVDKYLNEQQDELRKFTDSIKIATKEKIENLERSLEDDKLLSILNSLFEVGQGFSFNQIIDIIQEGKTRYEFKISPGYEDYNKINEKNGKEGIQIFGDLIIWKEILDLARKVQKPIVLISNEFKPDWCYRVEKQPHIERPKEDLLREILDFAGVEFWMYSNVQLLYFAKEYLNSQIAEKEFMEVAEVSEQQSKHQLGCVFTWPVNSDTSIGENPLTKSLMYLTPANGGKLSIDWGDGTPLEELNDTNNSVSHDYQDFGIYTVKVFGDIHWFCAMAIGGSKPRRWTQYPRIINLHIEDSIYLDRLQCINGFLDNLDLRGLPKLTQLLVSGNHLSELDLSSLNHLRILYCDSNLISELNVDKNQWISKLICSHNKLQELNLEKQSLLEELVCTSNNISKIILSENNLLKRLDCSRNSLQEKGLNEIFERLPIGNSCEINIKGNIGAATCNRSIAEDKGWIVVEK